MLKHEYIKTREEKLEYEALIDSVDDFGMNRKSAKPLSLFQILFSVSIFLVVAFSVNTLWLNNSISVTTEESVKLASAPVATTAAKTGTISIPVGTVKANPFLPYKELKSKSELDVPGFSLVEPPEVLSETSEAARIMDTVVSGILYDKFSPSAILNIEGTDYLVKKGDVVNSYKVLNIMSDSVTVKLGENVYQAGIGEILVDGTLNHNEVSNLSDKFGGIR